VHRELDPAGADVQAQVVIRVAVARLDRDGAYVHRLLG
jgi:hypothetical protein